MIFYVHNAELLGRLKGFYRGVKCESSGGWFNKEGGSLDMLTTSHMGLLALIKRDEHRRGCHLLYQYIREGVETLWY